MKRYKLSERKKKFAEYYLSPDRSSETMHNAYRSALKAGYSDSYAKKITSYMWWTELARMAEESGTIILSESTREYVYKNIE